MRLGFNTKPGPFRPCAICISPGQPRLLVRGYVDRPVLAKTLGLRNDQRIILAQSVGYPKK